MLSYYTQRNIKKKDIFQAKNTKFFHDLQSSLIKVSGLVIDNIFPLHRVGYVKKQSCLSYVYSRYFSETSWAKKNYTLLTSKLYDWDNQNFKKIIERIKRFAQKIYPKTEKIRRVYLSIMASCTFRRSFEPN